MFKYLSLSIVAWIYSAYHCLPVHAEDGLLEFPPDFLFGVGSSSYQVEGAWNEGGKSLGSWDYFSHTKPEIMEDLSNGDISSDAYHKTEADVSNLKHLGVHVYRFSLSWPRIMPFPNKVNMEGINYYNHLIDLLLKNNIKPMVTLFHWDMPQHLQDLGGFTNPVIADHFVHFSSVAFKHFGDRVKLWSTINEAKVYCVLGYGDGLLAPGINQSGIADYMCGHNVLKAHAKVYHLYNDTFKPSQKGKITLTVDCPWGEPASNSTEDKAAANRYIQFEGGWFMHPVFSSEGDYPPVMKKYIAERSKAQGYPHSRLPTFTQKEIVDIKGTYDALFLNYYIIELIRNKKVKSFDVTSYYTDRECDVDFDNSWGNSSNQLFKVVPWGLTKILAWIKEEYGNPEIYITENGYAGEDEIVDTRRISYHKGYLGAILEAIYKHGVNVKGYIAWSFLDSFEWFHGYTLKFGFYHINFTDPLRRRTPKSSVEYYRKVISTRKP